jgi:hypothetical protein
VTVTGVSVATVHLKKNTATDAVIKLSGSLDSAGGDNLANYQLAAPGKGKKSKSYSSMHFFLSRTRLEEKK